MLGRNTMTPQQSPASCNGDAFDHSEILCSRCSIDTTVKHLTGLEPNLPFVTLRYVIGLSSSHRTSRSVPIIPPLITGPCVYGHIINDENKDHFRQLYPKVQQWQSSDPETLVAFASLIHYEKRIFAITADVYDQGHWHICLVHVDCRFPGRVIDERGTRDFMEAIENSLGITGEPKWYPCYSS